MRFKRTLIGGLSIVGIGAGLYGVFQLGRHWEANKIHNQRDDELDEKEEELVKLRQMRKPTVAECVLLDAANRSPYVIDYIPKLSPGDREELRRKYFIIRDYSQVFGPVLFAKTPEEQKEAVKVAKQILEDIHRRQIQLPILPSPQNSNSVQVSSYPPLTPQPVR